MFELLPDESCLGFVAENQVCIGHSPVLAEVPRLADLEVATQLRRRVRPQRNCHHGIEKFLGLFEVAFDSRQIDKPNLGKLPKQRQVRFEVVDKFREAHSGVVCAIASSFVVFEMVDRVNDKLSEERQFLHIWWYWSKYQRLFAEYKRLYPDGGLYRRLRTLWVLSSVCFLIVFGALVLSES